jgi:hypothetical protein
MSKKLVTVMIYINEVKEVQIEVDDNKNLEDQVVDWAKRQYSVTDVITDYFEDDDPVIEIYK